MFIKIYLILHRKQSLKITSIVKMETIEKVSEYIIRPVTTADAAQLVSIYSYYVENTAITFEYETPSTEEFAGRIANTLAKYPYLCVEHNGKILGYTYAGVFKNRPAYNHCVELTIYIDCNAHKRGLGRKLYAAIETELAKRGILNLYACIAYPAVEDEYLTRNSAEFHSHLGFATVGEFHKCGYKFGRWYNMIWMEKLIGYDR